MGGEKEDDCPGGGGWWHLNDPTWGLVDFCGIRETRRNSMGVINTFCGTANRDSSNGTLSAFDCRGLLAASGNAMQRPHPAVAVAVAAREN